MATPSILIVDDEIIIARELEVRLKDGGYGVAGIASTGREAVRMAAELRPDLVLMDIVLKGDMDGIEAAAEIRRTCQVPVIYVTAYTDTRAADLAWALGREPLPALATLDLELSGAKLQLRLLGASHQVLLEECPNRRLVRLAETLRRSLRRYLHHYLQRGGRVSLSTLQHTRIAEALRKGDRAAARQLLERKWRRGMDEIEGALR